MLRDPYEAVMGVIKDTAPVAVEFIVTLPVEPLMDIPEPAVMPVTPALVNVTLPDDPPPDRPVPATTPEMVPPRLETGQLFMHDAPMQNRGAVKVLPIAAPPVDIKDATESPPDLIWSVLPVFIGASHPGCPDGQVGGDAGGPLHA
jgi:hypothetical protein